MRELKAKTSCVRLLHRVVDSTVGCSQKKSSDCRRGDTKQVVDNVTSALVLNLAPMQVGQRAIGLEQDIKNSVADPRNFAALTLLGPSGSAKLLDEPKRKSFDKQIEVLSEIRSRSRDIVGGHHKQPAGVMNNVGDAIADPKESTKLREICTFWNATLENESFPVMGEVLKRKVSDVVFRFANLRQGLQRRNLTNLLLF